MHRRASVRPDDLVTFKGGQQHGAEPLDRVQLGRRGLPVRGADGVGQIHRVRVVAPRVTGVESPVGGGDEVQHLRGLFDPRSSSRDQLRPAQVVGCSQTGDGVEAPCEGGQDGPQLGIGVIAIGIDEGGRDAECLGHDVPAEPVGAAPSRPGLQPVQGGGGVLHEVGHCGLEGDGGHGPTVRVSTTSRR
jgi:hypothetical protein